MAQGIDELESLCRSVLAKVQKAWSWDDRFGAVLVTFETAEKQILVDVTTILGKGWKSSNIGEAPERIQALADDAGGLDPGQWLLHSDHTKGALLYATVWPWGNGKTISLRVSYQVPGMPDGERPASDAKLKSWFGVK
jgi:hypothetical protein